MSRRVNTALAQVLLSLEVDVKDVLDAKETFAECPALLQTLENPTVSQKEKHAVIEKIFPASLHTFLKVVCQNNSIGEIDDIFTEYIGLEHKSRGCADAVIEYVTPLTEAQLSSMKKFVCAKTGMQEVSLELKQNPALLGGFILQIGDMVYDRSLKTKMAVLQKNLTRR